MNCPLLTNPPFTIRFAVVAYVVGGCTVNVSSTVTGDDAVLVPPPEIVSFLYVAGDAGSVYELLLLYSIVFPALPINVFVDIVGNTSVPDVAASFRVPDPFRVPMHVSPAEVPRSRVPPELMLMLLDERGVFTLTVFPVRITTLSMLRGTMDPVRLAPVGSCVQLAAVS